MFLPDVASFVSALLFAVHPIHTEAVSLIKAIYGPLGPGLGSSDTFKSVIEIKTNDYYCAGDGSRGTS